MSEDFDIKVKVDPGSAIPTIKSTESELARLEDTADSAKRAFAKLGEAIRQDMVTKAADAQRAFKSLGEAIRMEVNAKINEAKAAMRSLADAIAMEARVLEQATGKARDHGLQLAALQKLHNEGRISGEQYITTLERMGVEFEQTAAAAEKLARAQAQQATKTIGFGNAKPESIQQGGSFNPLALAGGAAAAGAAIQQIAAISDRYTELENSALKFVDAGHSVSQILDEQRNLARSLNSSIEATIGAYDGVRDATDSLTLTHEEQIRLTKTLGEAAQLSGKSMESAAEQIHNLSVAFEAGRDPGEALFSLFKQYPDIGEQMTHSLGITSKQMIDMARDGRLSAEQLVLSLTKATDEIDAKFAKRARTWSQDWDDFKDDVFRPLPIEQLTAPFGTLDMYITRLTDDATKLAERWQKLEDLRPPRFAAVTGHLAGGIGASIASSVASDQARETGAAARANDDYAMSLAEVNREYERSLANLRALREAQQRDRQWRQQMKEQRTSLFGADSVTSGIGALPDYSGVDETLRRYAEDEKRRVTDLTEAWRRKMEMINRNGEAMERLGATIAPVGHELIEMFKNGEFSASRFESVLRDVAIELLKMQAIEAIGPGGGYAAFFRGLVGGFAHGGEYTVPRSPDYFLMPRAANGNTWQFGGGGQQDEHMFMARVSSGETLEVRTQRQELANAQFMARQQQAMSMGGRGGGSGRPIMIFRSDPREVTAAMGTLAGQRQYVNLERQFRRRRLG